MEGAKMSSIFLSHNHKDKPFARRLSERLKFHGISTWIDEAEIQVGDSLISKIESAIREFTYLGVILSPNSISSEWVSREVKMALTEEIQGRRVKVLPLLYKGCEVPGFLVDKVYADFTKDFEEGFEKLLARLNSDLHEEKYKQRRADAIFQLAYQDWITFGKQDFHLLDKHKLSLVLHYLEQPKLSLDLMEYLLCSVSYLPQAEELLDFDTLKDWVRRLGAGGVADLFNRLLEHPTPQVRLGAMTLVRRLELMNAIDTIIARIKDESDRDVKRAGLQSIFHLGKPLPNELAQFLLDNDEDWLVQSYALRNLAGYRSCLLISDETKFATELGALAQGAGFRLITSSTSLLSWEIEKVGDEVLKVHELLILVRGEHFTQYKNEHFYSSLRRFVTEGGSLFATSWVSWETKYHYEFAGVLPFTHIRDIYDEDVVVTCKPTESKLAQKLFPNQISYRTSFELLRNREGSIMLFKTDSDIPIFGYRRFGSGTCYYLNTCQHFCLGSMLSPLQTSSELHDCFQRVFEWIYKTLP